MGPTAEGPQNEGMTDDEGPTVHAVQLGRVLRELREAADITREQAGAAIDRSAPTVKRLELGKVLRPSEATVTALLDLYDADDDARALCATLRQGARVRGWWAQRGLRLRESYRHFIGLESAASRILDFSAVIVPGLLQTEDYARALMLSANPDAPPEDIDQFVRVRMERQQRIYQTDRPPLVLHALMDEACLRRQVGGADVWRAQLRHLIEASAMRNVTVQIVPFEAGAHASTLGSFIVLMFPGGEPVGFVELLAGDISVEGPAADRYRLTFDRLRAVALSPALSVARIWTVLAMEG